MDITIEVTQEFIDYRNEKQAMYNQRGRTDRKFQMDLDCELFEWYMINVTEDWEDEPDDWMGDAIIPSPDGYKTVDVKFIAGYYNIDRGKMLNIIQQRHVLDGYQFMEWVSKPRRPLVVGDTVTCRGVGYLTHEELLDNLRRSYKEAYGFYADVRKYIAS